MTSGKFVTTLGYERRFNPAFQHTDRDTFVAFMNEGQPSRPANVENIVAINQGRQPLTRDLPQLQAFSPAELVRRMAGGVRVVDGRSESDFGAGHIPGAVNVQLSSSEFEQRIGWVLPGDAELVLVAASDADALKAQKAMAFIGLDVRLSGYLAGGMGAWQAAGLAVELLPQIRASELKDLIAAGEVIVLDVRETDEWNDGHIQGAKYMNYKFLGMDHQHLQLDPARQIAVTCAGGFRSSTAGSILQGLGYTNVLNLVGGMGEWEKAGYPRVDGEGMLC